MDHAGITQDSRDLKKLRSIARALKPLADPRGDFYHYCQLDHLPENMQNALRRLDKFHV